MPDELSFEDEIQQLLEADPFKPFVLSLTSGERLKVENPDRFAMGQSTITIYHHREGRTFFRKNQLVSVEAAE